MCRLGGSALAQCYGQLGNDVPDIEDTQVFVRAFNVTQQLIKGLFQIYLNKLILCLI